MRQASSQSWAELPCRAQHAAAALEQFAGEEMYEPVTSEPGPGTQAHRTNIFVREVQHTGESFGMQS